mgnify:CR=1 FL=1
MTKKNLILIMLGLFLSYQPVLASEPVQTISSGSVKTAEVKIVHENKLPAVNSEVKSEVSKAAAPVSAAAEKKASPEAKKTDLKNILEKPETEKKIEHTVTSEAKKETPAEIKTTGEIKLEPNHKVINTGDRHIQETVKPALDSKKLNTLKKEKKSRVKKHHPITRHAKKSRKSKNKKSEYVSDSIQNLEKTQNGQIEVMPAADEKIAVIKVKSDSGLTNEYRIADFDASNGKDMAVFIEWLNKVNPSGNYQMIIKEK